MNTQHESAQLKQMVLACLEKVELPLWVVCLVLDSVKTEVLEHYVTLSILRKEEVEQDGE